jgi:hypothetical protein
MQLDVLPTLQHTVKNIQDTVSYSTYLYVHIDENKSRIANSEALRLLIDLARSKDQRVQRNATGALLNMTHTRELIVFMINCDRFL